MANTQAQQTELLKIFERRRPDGRFYYSDSDVRHFLPAMALSSNVDVAKHPHLQTVMNELSAKLGLPKDASESSIANAIKAYYVKNPINPELLAEYRAFCRKH